MSELKSVSAVLPGTRAPLVPVFFFLTASAASSFSRFSSPARANSSA